MESSSSGFRRYSASSISSSQSIESGGKWVMERESRKSSWENVRAIADKDKNVEHLFASVARPTTSNGTGRPMSRGEEVRPVTGNKKNPRNTDPNFTCVHPQFGKSPYLMPIIRKVHYASNYNATQASTRQVKVKEIERASTAPASTTISRGSSVGSLVSSSSGSKVNSIIFNEQHNIGATNDHAKPFKKLLQFHANSRPSDAFINSNARHAHSRLGNTTGATEISQSVENFPSRIDSGSPSAGEADPLYEIMRSNKFEMLRFAMHFAEEKGYLSGNTAHHNDWVRYFEHHLGISHNKDGDYREYDAIYDQYVSNSRKLVSDRLSGCRASFKTTEYFPGQKRQHRNTRILDVDVEAEAETGATKVTGVDKPQLPEAPDAPFPIEEFIIISPQEVSLLAEFNTPPIEIWATLKVVMYLFSSYHSHTTMVEQECKILQEEQAKLLSKSSQLGRTSIEKYMMDPVKNPRSRTVSSDSFDEDLDEQERQRKFEMRQEIKKVGILLRQPKKSDSFMGKLDLDYEIRADRYSKLHGSGSSPSQSPPPSRGGGRSASSHSLASRQASSVASRQVSSLASRQVSSTGHSSPLLGSPTQPHSPEETVHFPARSLVSLLPNHDGSSYDTVVPEHKILQLYTDHSKGPLGSSTWSEMGSPKESKGSPESNNRQLFKGDDIPQEKSQTVEEIRTQLDLPARPSTLPKETMDSYWADFAQMKKLTTDPVTPSLAVNKAFVSGMKVLSAESGDMQTRSYAKVVGERIDRSRFYGKSPLTVQAENEEIDKTNSQKAAISVNMLANASVEFSWDAFRQFIRKHPTEFCLCMADILKDEDYFVRFPEGLLSELRHLVVSQLFQPIKLLAFKCKTGAKLCLWCRRVIALLYDGHLHSIRTTVPNSIVEPAVAITPGHGSPSSTFSPLQPDVNNLGPSTSTSLFHLHGLSGTSSKDKLSRIVNYYIPYKLPAATTSVNSKGEGAATKTAVHDEHYGITHVREPMKFCVEVMPAPFSTSSGTSATSVTPTPGALLAFHVTLDMVRPMDAMQIIAAKNTGITKHQREVRLYALLQHLRSGFSSGGNKLLDNLKTREDVEVYEKRELIWFFKDLVARYADHGGMPSPTFNSVALPAQRQKKVTLHFPAALGTLTRGSNAHELNSQSADTDSEVPAGEGAVNSLTDVFSLSYEPHGAVAFGATKKGLGSCDGFVVVGYDFEEPVLGQKSPGEANERYDSSNLTYRASLTEVGYGWIHRHGILRDAKNSIVVAKAQINTRRQVRYVVAVNESQSSKAALIAAARLAKPGDAICVFHVLDYSRQLNSTEREEYEKLLSGQHLTTSKGKPIPVTKPGTPSFTTSVLRKKNADLLKEFAKITAVKRAQDIVFKFKRYGYNVMLLDINDEEVGVDDEQGNPVHPIVHLANKIAKAAIDFDPTYLVMGIGNYDRRTIQRYYESLPNSSNGEMRLASDLDPDRWNTFTTITEQVVDNPLVTCSVIATVKE